MKQFTFYMLVICALITGCTANPELGVSLDLAKQRKQNIFEVVYSLNFTIPPINNDDIVASQDVIFSLKDTKQGIILDFRAEPSQLIKVVVNGEVCKVHVENGHIVIPSKYLVEGQNVINIDFIAGSQSLNRKSDFLYSLLVPDRASTVFPCFDQPDMKAIFNLTLNVPNGWRVASNSSVTDVSTSDSTCRYIFAATKPISTYLFAFATGKFSVDSCTRNGRTILMYYRETDEEKIQSNRDIIFGSHFDALCWMEDYTEISYPFDKLDIVLIPDFQYGGMEHAGCIFYNEGRIVLDKNPSENQLLSRANLIAHEVSHQWFGNLVTMRWFNDVWLKEVFAGLMADKVVNPQYPNINHKLSFILSHFPRAYSVDRTMGTNPIGQELDNMLLAGTLYGDIIYHKAPVAFNQLEILLGCDSFRLGLQRYLKRYYMSNADWGNLIEILDSLAEVDLSNWSKLWVYGTGQPQITMTFSAQTGMKLEQISEGVQLPMSYSICADGNEFAVNHFDRIIDVESFDINSHAIQMNYNGEGYGVFIPDSIHLHSLIDCNLTSNNSVARASNLINLHELFLQGRVGQEAYFKYMLCLLEKEENPQIRNYIGGNIETVYWRFMHDGERLLVAEQLECCLERMLNKKNLSPSEQKPIFMMFSRIALTDRAVSMLYSVWCKKMNIDGVELSENDFVKLACELAIRSLPQSDSILHAQEMSITNPDRLAKFRYVMKSVTPNNCSRVEFFKDLSDVNNRRPEQWVIEALRYFNHPLRADFALNYLSESLDLLPEIQRTGDIFFPKSWLDAVLWGHSSSEAQQVVRQWLVDNPHLSSNLRSKLLQSADILKRAND